SVCLLVGFASTGGAVGRATVERAPSSDWHGCNVDERRFALYPPRTILATRNGNKEVPAAFVTSPKGLHGWKHRFAVNRAHPPPVCAPVAPQPSRFGSIGLHGVPIGSIPLQSCGRS